MMQHLTTSIAVDRAAPMVGVDARWDLGWVHSAGRHFIVLNEVLTTFNNSQGVAFHVQDPYGGFMGRSEWAWYFVVDGTLYDEFRRAGSGYAW